MVKTPKKNIIDQKPSAPKSPKDIAQGKTSYNTSLQGQPKWETYKSAKKA